VRRGPGGLVNLPRATCAKSRGSVKVVSTPHGVDGRATPAQTKFRKAIAFSPSPRDLPGTGLREGANHLNSGTVIRCLTIAIEDAVALNIALELIMPGWPPRYLDEQIKQRTASPLRVEARP
jgi:hypothetical protein